MNTWKIINSSTRSSICNGRIPLPGNATDQTCSDTFGSIQCGDTKHQKPSNTTRMEDTRLTAKTHPQCEHSSTEDLHHTTLARNTTTEKNWKLFDIDCVQRMRTEWQDTIAYHFTDMLAAMKMEKIWETKLGSTTATKAAAEARTLAQQLWCSVPELPRHCGFRAN